LLVIPGLVPGTHPSASTAVGKAAQRGLPSRAASAQAWIPGTRPGMTSVGKGRAPAPPSGLAYICAMPTDTAPAPLKGAALIKDECKRLPDRPGVYRMMGEDGEVLYVGKARSLKKRVLQYAQGRFHTQRIAHMVDATRSMEFVTTRTET